MLEKIKDLHTCISRHTEQCPYGDEDGVSQHHADMDQNIKDWKTHGQS